MIHLNKFVFIVGLAMTPVAPVRGQADQADADDAIMTTMVSYEAAIGFQNFYNADAAMFAAAQETVDAAYQAKKNSLQGQARQQFIMACAPHCQTVLNKVASANGKNTTAIARMDSCDEWCVAGDGYYQQELWNACVSCYIDAQIDASEALDLWVEGIDEIEIGMTALASITTIIGQF